MAFPTSPSDGDTYTNANGTTYEYVDADNKWKILVQGDYTDHLTDTSNPHSVVLSDVSPADGDLDMDGYEIIDCKNIGTLRNGVFWATYNFMEDAVGATGTDISVITADGSDSSCEGSIVEEIEGHRNVLKILDNNGSGKISIAMDGFGDPTADNVWEFYYMTTDNTATNRLQIFIQENNTNRIRFRFVYSGFQNYDSGSGYIYKYNSFSSNIWYHIKLVLDDSANTYDLYVNGVLEESGMDYYTNSSTGTNEISILTEDSYTDPVFYLDAISWSGDDNYYEGDNLGINDHYFNVHRPSFHVYKDDTTQTISDSTITKVVWNAEDFDTNSDFDLGNDKFVAPEDGVYHFTAAILLESATGWDSEERAILYVYKNGSEEQRIDLQQVPASPTNHQIHLHGSATLSLNVDDEITIYIYQNSGGNKNIYDNATYSPRYNYFCGFRVS